MEASFRQRLDLSDALLRERLGLSDTEPLKLEIMAEFDVVLHQMPYVGGATSRMSTFFMRNLAFMAIGRVLRRHGVPAQTIGEIELQSMKAQMHAVPEAERLESGRQYMSAENRKLMREQAENSKKKKYRDDFVYDIVEPGPGGNFEFGIDYKECGFCKFAAKNGDQDRLPHICAEDYAAYEARGIHLERTQTLAGGATHCNFRFSRRPRQPDVRFWPIADISFCTANVCFRG
jgi:hypothetical protein